MKKFLFFLLIILYGHNFFANTILNGEYIKKTDDLVIVYPVFENLGHFMTESSSGLRLGCNATNFPVLETTSLNGIVGSWSPSVVSSVNSEYVFTPNPGQNSGNYLFILEISNQPYFYELQALGWTTLSNSNNFPDLPLISSNGFPGTWSPSVITNVNGASYTFTPLDPCGLQTIVNVAFWPVESNCNTFLILDTPEINTSRYYKDLVIRSEDNYSVSGNKSILLEGIFYVELMPNTVIESDQFFEARVDVSACVNNRNSKPNSISEFENKIKELTLSPNPTSNSIEISMKNSTFNKVLINSIDGKTVLDKNIENSESFQVDVSNYANGLYIVNVIDKDGQVYNQKLIKN